jgi:hypothetical protein
MSATQAKHLCRAWAGSGGAASGDVGAKRLHRLGPHVPVVRLPRSLIAQVREGGRKGGGRGEGGRCGSSVGCAGKAGRSGRNLG